MTEDNTHICKVLSGIFSVGLGFAFGCHHSFVLQGSKAWVWVGFEVNTGLFALALLGVPVAEL